MESTRINFEEIEGACSLALKLTLYSIVFPSLQSQIKVKVKYNNITYLVIILNFQISLGF